LHKNNISKFKKKKFFAENLLSLKIQRLTQSEPLNNFYLQEQPEQLLQVFEFLFSSFLKSEKPVYVIAAAIIRYVIISCIIKLNLKSGLLGEFFLNFF